VLMAKRYGLVEYLTTGQRPQTEGRRDDRKEQVAKALFCTQVGYTSENRSPKKSLVSVVSKTMKKRKELQLAHGKTPELRKFSR